MSWFELGTAALNVAGRIGAAGAANPAQAAPNNSGGLFDSSGWTVKTGGGGGIAPVDDLSRYLPWAMVALVAVLYFRGRK